MRILLLGTGGYHPSERRHTACLLLPELGILLDAGTATFRVMPALPGRTLDVFLSHAHLDHVVGLTYLLAPLALGELEAVRVHAAPETLDAVRTHLFSQPLFPVLPPFDFRPLDASPVQLASGAAVAWRRLDNHPGGSIAYRVDAPDDDGGMRRIAYVTDTTVDGSYADFVQGVNLLIHECYFPDDEHGWASKTGHSHTRPVLELARDAGVRRLLLTHVDPRNANADPAELSRFPGVFADVAIAEDGMDVQI
ncbi:MAG: metal-dependent hydrolase [Planctomyces sp.]|nr:metal-dependent hydrolase [Planctomyces sp.]